MKSLYYYIGRIFRYKYRIVKYPDDDFYQVECRSGGCWHLQDTTQTLDEAKKIKLFWEQYDYSGDSYVVK